MIERAMHILTVLLVAAAAMVAQAPATRPTTAPVAGQETVVNPHWTRDGCKVCHEYADGKVLPVPAERVNGQCLECHDGKKAWREVHPVGRLFTSPQVHLPEGWPAPGGRLECNTCHDIHPGRNYDMPRPANNPAFLRDWDPRGKLLRAFCAKCHPEPTAGGMYNPHRMLDEQGRPIIQSCLFCHRTSMTRLHETNRTGEAELQADAITLCVVCHNRHVEYFEPGHISLKLPVRYRDRWDNARQYLPTKLARVPATQPAGQLLLPLDNGRIVCATCHNPHQQGVFPAHSELEFGAVSIDQPAQWERLRGFGKELCSVCHER